MSHDESNVAVWRWRPHDGGLWIYDPEPEWLERQGDAIEKQPLYLAKPVSSPAGGGVVQTGAITEMLGRWQAGYAFDEDNDADVDLEARVEAEIAALSQPTPAGSKP